LILIDSPYPINHEPLPKQVIDRILRPNCTTDIHDLPANDILLEEFQRNAALLGDYKPTELTGSKAFGVPTVMLQSMDTFDTVTQCGVEYPWLSSQSARDDAVTSWEVLIGDKLEVYSIPGNHFEAFSPDMVCPTHGIAGLHFSTHITYTSASRLTRLLNVFLILSTILTRSRRFKVGIHWCTNTGQHRRKRWCLLCTYRLLLNLNTSDLQVLSNGCVILN
jgi:hypothetical protein